ncbi:MAG: ATP-binding protein [Planctomycetes bacterium]|nr:ATP-binding protein [Planctomycetota bacterium]
MSERQRFNLHLPGLLKVLAEHLYSSKRVGVRELIQNSHDSCVRRRIEGDEPDYEPRIDLSIDPDQRTLTVSDNGYGLTADEITTYLATIGRGYTRELRERLSLDDAAAATELIGQFGLGFLSAFLLASEVTLLTRSAQGGPCYGWHSGGDEYYQMQPAWREEIGTTVELRLKPAASFLLQERSLIETVRQYADFLPIPIHVQEEQLPVNLMAPPWEADHPDRAIKDYISRAFRTESLWVMPLRDWKVDLGHDTLTVPLNGFLFVPPGSVASVREFGDLNVYIRRMFICERERDLLPPWARFVRGVVDSPLLQPTASRESIHQDDNFELVRQAMEEQLGEGLRELAREEVSTWKRIVRGHADLIISWAVSDNEFFDRVEDIVTFRTSRGPLSLREYLDLSGGTLYYVTRELGSLQEQVLAEGRDVPAIDASWSLITPFLEKYASRHPDVALVQLDGEAEQLLRPVSEEKFAALLDFYRRREVKARVASFKPAEAPALVLYPQGAELAREAQESRQAGDLPGPLAGLVQEYIDQKFSGGTDLRGTLYLNASCPLVRQLAEKPPAAETLSAVLTLLHQVARLFAGRMLSAADAVEAFGETTQAIQGLLRA